jgi:hypothetical protein
MANHEVCLVLWVAWYNFVSMNPVIGVTLWSWRHPFCCRRRRFGRGAIEWRGL